MKVVVTGADGFVGWHLRARLEATTDHLVVPVGRSAWRDLDDLCADADAVIHVAGVNRGDDGTVRDGNLALAEDVARALRRPGAARRVVFANSIRADEESPYGDGKRGAAAILRATADEVGATFVDVRLPNLFGEHGVSRYNSFVATFVEAALAGETPTIVDRPVELLHVQPAAGALVAGLTTADPALAPSGTPTSVVEVHEILRQQARLYAQGDFPPLDDDLRLDLFNTLRAAAFTRTARIELTPREDERGRLVETVRAHGGKGQTFVSTSRPGVTRGEHYHLRKVERFVVLAGRARISLRRLLTGDVVSFDVDGDDPVALDMPTMWVHNITNTGPDPLTTLFWTHELFDPAAPDTYPEPVCLGPDREAVGP